MTNYSMIKKKLSSHGKLWILLIHITKCKKLSRKRCNLYDSDCMPFRKRPVVSRGMQEEMNEYRDIRKFLGQ